MGPICDGAARRMSRRNPRLWIVGCAWLAGCAAAQQGETTPENHSVVREQLVVHSDFPLAERHRLLDELVARRMDVCQTLQLPVSDEPVHVYLFETPDRFQAFIAAEYPDFPHRRAFFVESDTRLAVYAHWGDRVAEDLRHEVVHGYLHAVVPNLPLWLDEGLAEFFEVSRGQDVNWPHVELLARELRTVQDRPEGRPWQPDLPRLESLAAADQLRQRDYAESWGWIHLLLTTTPERLAIVRGHLHALREHGTALPLSRVLAEREPDIGQRLIDHLSSLEHRR